MATTFKYSEYQRHFGYTKSHGFKDFYKFYINSLVDKDNKDNPYRIDSRLYGKLLRDFFKAVMDYMLYENYIFDPGINIGIFFVGKSYRGKMNNLAVNWKETKKQGRIIHHLNDHTQYYIYRILWKSRRYSNYDMQTIGTYKFLPSRANKRLLARLILDEGYDYIEYKKGDEHKMM